MLFPEFFVNTGLGQWKQCPNVPATEANAKEYCKDVTDSVYLNEIYSIMVLLECKKVWTNQKDQPGRPKKGKCDNGPPTSISKPLCLSLLCT